MEHTGIEDLMAGILKWGVFLSAGVILLGFMLLMGLPAPDGPEYLTSIPAIWSGLRTGNPNAIIMAGLMVLLATPFVRVVASVVAFVRRGEGWHVAISAAVLMVLLVSIAVGQGH